MTATSASRRRLSLLALVSILVVAGLAQSIHRHYEYEVPWIPGVEKAIWSIEARIQFVARGEPVTVNLRRPRDQRSFSVLDESGASPGYGLNFIDLDGLPTAQWTIREADGRQTLYYRTDVLQRENAEEDPIEVPPPPIQSPRWQGPYATAADAVLSQAISLSSDPFSLTRQLIGQFRLSDRAQNEQLLVDVAGEENLTELLADLLQRQGDSRCRRLRSGPRRRPTPPGAQAAAACLVRRGQRNLPGCPRRGRAAQTSHYLAAYSWLHSRSPRRFRVELELLDVALRPDELRAGRLGIGGGE